MSFQTNHKGIETVGRARFKNETITLVQEKVWDLKQNRILRIGNRVLIRKVHAEGEKRVQT